MSEQLVSCDRDWAQLSHAARIDALVSLDRQMAALHAAQLRLLAALAVDPPTTSLRPDDRRWVQEDVACALRLSPATATARLAEAAELSRLPGALALLDGGAITVAHCRALADQTMPLDDAAAAAVEQRVLERAPQQSVGTFRSAVRRAVLGVAAASIEQRRHANLADRRVLLRPAGEGVAELWALLPVEGAAAVMAAVDALADRVEVGDDRSADQRRADALVQLGLDALAGDATLPRRQRMRPAIQVTVAMSTLLGLDDNAGELSRVGPISAALARRLAADDSGTWRRLVTDPVGRLIDYGRSTYRPPSALRQHVIARDRTCRFPHCTRVAERGELDHTVPWSDGGPTNANNIVALCRRHHHLRHDTGWDYQRAPGDGDGDGDGDGALTWRTPTGHRYSAPDATYPIDQSTPQDPPDPPDPQPDDDEPP